MHRLVLSCLCVGWLLGGGACSARALLRMELTTSETQALRGTLAITVKVDDVTLVKMPETVGELVVSSDQSEKIGVYLPEGTEGVVSVSVGLLRTCMVGLAESFPAEVHAGKATAILPVPLHRNPDCPDMTIGPIRDGGSDDTGERPPPDDGGTPDLTTSAGRDAGDGGTPDGGGGVPDADPNAPTCAELCLKAVMYCAPHQIPELADVPTCMAACHGPPGVRGMTSGNTIGCRLTYANPGAMNDRRLCESASSASQVCID